MRFDPATEAKIKSMASKQGKPKNPVLELPKESALEGAFSGLWQRFGNGQKPESEFRFDDERKYRFDFAWVTQKVAVELDGYQHHSSRGGFKRDRAKSNLAQSLGWQVLSFTSEDIHQRPVETIELVKRVLEKRA